MHIQVGMQHFVFIMTMDENVDGDNIDQKTVRFKREKSQFHSLCWDIAMGRVKVPLVVMDGNFILYSDWAEC